MPVYTIETTRFLPSYRHRTYRDDTVAGACRQAVEDKDWRGMTLDRECAGETFVTGIWKGAEASRSAPPVLIPSHFEESIQRRARQFEVLHGLLKMLLDDVRAGRPSSDEWIERAASAVARGDAILADARDPEEPTDDGGTADDVSPSGEGP
ncbi:hypothetical protein [Terrihabitans sp. B22-R8]|uniref:hypothetical protein n=1 Tax=Terrihabitans sp. B22-R8 TaxID=3425128 RepID=UPI00403C869F